MNVYEIVMQSEKPLVVFTDQATKQQLLRQLSQAKVFKAMQFFTQKDLYEKVFFAYREATLFTMAEWLNLQPKIVETIIKHLYLIDVNHVYESSWLNQLKMVKLRLVAEKKLIFYPYLEQLFKGKTVVSTLEENDLNSHALKIVSGYAKVETVSVHPRNTKAYLATFETIEDEVIHCAMRLRHTECLTHQAVLVSHDDYRPIIERIFHQFELPFQWLKGEPLLAYPPVQRFLNDLKKSLEPIEKRIESALQNLKEESEPIVRRLTTKIVQIINGLVTYYHQPERFIELFQYICEKTAIKPHRVDGAIFIGQYEDLPFSSLEVLHVLGASEGIFPKPIEPFDTLSDAERKELSMRSVQQLNTDRKLRWITTLSRLPQVYYSYALKGAKEVFYRANLLDDLELKKGYQSFPTYDMESQCFSARYDLMVAKELYDYQKETQEEVPSLKRYYHWFKEQLTPHNPAFTGVSAKTLKEIMPKQLSISYSKLTTFYKCQFRYLLDHILKLDDPTDTLAIDIGSFFHEVIEKHAHYDTLSDTLLETTLNDLLKRGKRSYSEREMFFLRYSFETLKIVFEEIKRQENRSDYTVLEREVSIEKKYLFQGKSVRFSGVIDKLLVRDEAGLSHVLLFDYKTGKPTLKLHHSYYGFDSQLVFYLVLLKIYFADKPYKVNGFYEQLIYPKPPKYQEGKTKAEQINDSLAWVGYTIDNEQEVHYIDPLASQKSMISGMRFNKDDRFNANVKTYPEALITPLTEHVEEKIVKAIEAILQGDFAINPKRNQNAKDLSCLYCQYQDICYKRYEDYRDIRVPENLDDLMDSLKRGESE